MPRLNVFQPFRSSSRRDREVVQYQPQDSRVAHYDAYEQPRQPTRSGSRWRNVLTKRGRPRDQVVYANGTNAEYIAPPPEVRGMPIPHRRTTVEDYDSESLTTESEDYPVRHPQAVQDSQADYAQRAPSHVSFPGEPEQFVQRMPSHTSFAQEAGPPPSMGPPSSAPPFVAPPGEVYMEEPQTPQNPDGSQYDQEPPVIQAEPRRFRPRRGEPITVGNMRIEVEDDGRQHRSHRSRGSRSRSRSADSYSSRSSRSYSSYSSVEENPIIISADPHTQIEIGNERDGFVPYEQYVANREERRRQRRRRHRHTPEEEIYVVPAGANVIFVDEDGHELHRVGDFDDRYSGRRRNSRARTTRQILPVYDEVKDLSNDPVYAEQAIQTESVDIDVQEQASEDIPAELQVDPKTALHMHERMLLFINSRPSSRASSPAEFEEKTTRIFDPTEVQLHGRPASPLFKPHSPLKFEPRSCVLNRRPWR